MSNKLYTEEEIIRAFGYQMSRNQVYEIVSTMRTIKLPSKEDIKEASLEENNDDLSPSEEFERGAEYVLDKIQGGNNEQ